MAEALAVHKWVTYVLLFTITLLVATDALLQGLQASGLTETSVSRFLDVAHLLRTAASVRRMLDWLYLGGFLALGYLLARWHLDARETLTSGEFGHRRG